jgi:hypothetical protein
MIGLTAALCLPIGTQVRLNVRKALEPIRNLVYVVILHPEDGEEPTNEHTLRVCRERINEREYGHRTLWRSEKVDGVLKMFEEVCV